VPGLAATLGPADVVDALFVVGALKNGELVTLFAEQSREPTRPQTVEPPAPPMEFKGMGAAGSA
jgi:hypothetical protein